MPDIGNRKNCNVRDIQSFTAQWDGQILCSFGKFFERFPAEIVYIVIYSYMYAIYIQKFGVRYAHFTDIEHNQ